MDELHGAAAEWRSTYDQVSWYPIVHRFIHTEHVQRHLGPHDWPIEYDTGRGWGTERATSEAVALLNSLREEARIAETGVSRREHEVVTLLAEGLSDTEIARRLTLSPRTVQAHLRSIYRKLGVTSRTGAVRAASLTQV